MQQNQNHLRIEIDVAEAGANVENLEDLVIGLKNMPNETDWLEFKYNNYNPEMIGADISALANSAALAEKACAYMIWGIDDSTHEIMGTEYNQYSKLVGNEEIGSWLRKLLSENADFEFHSIKMNDMDVTILIIYKAVNQPVRFKKNDYIRVGSYTKKLSEYPSMQSQLWDRLRAHRFEEQLVKQNLKAADALNYIDYPKYFDLMGLTIPVSLDGIIHYMLEEEVFKQQDNGLYGITNMGALLFARRSADFPRIARKSIRVVQYDGNNRLNMLKEDIGTKGYVVGFEGLVKFIEALIPTEEEIKGALRVQKRAYPLLAIREMVANALIHQDFSITGTGPLVEVFSNRIEVTNPGRPLVDIYRIIDNPPKSRNEKLASLMRRMRMCEELGTGWDKIAISCELAQLPAPRIELYEQSTKVTLFSEIPYSSLSIEDKLWACYLHACVKYVQGEQLTNSSLRLRFGLKETLSGSVSRLIKDAVEHKYIKPFDPSTAPRYMKYIPQWA